MGLDMYLTASISLWPTLYKGHEKIVETLNEMFNIKPDGYCVASEVSFEVAYWRKSNQIHKWFVDNCQDGRDECQTTFVPRVSLEELLEVCNKVLEDKNLASELLPVASGFFFGSEDYDESYFEDIKLTAERLTKILADKTLDEADFYYRSSW